MAKGEGSGEGKGRGLWGLGRNIFGLLCCLLCLGPILIIIGAIFLSSSIVDTRGNNIKAYNNAVTLWNNQYRNEFETAQFYVSQPGSYLDLMLPNNSTDQLKDSDQSGLTPYKPLKYTVKISDVYSSPVPFKPATATYDFSQGQAVSFTQIVDMMSSTNVSISELGGQCTYTNPSACSAACLAKQGNWDYNHDVCVQRLYVTDFCIKVFANGKNWDVSKSYGGAGCYGAGFPVTTTTMLDARDSGSAVYFSGSMTVRSLHDPYIFAAQLTDNTFSFGLTRVQKFVTGIALIAVGGCLLLPMILIFFCIRRRHYHHHHHHGGPTVIYQTVPAYQTPYQGY